MELKNDPIQSALLYGKSDRQGIVGLAMHPDGNKMQVWSNHKGANLLGRTNFTGLTLEDFYPFFWLKDINLLNNFPREQYRWVNLKGDNYYQVLVVFNNWFDMWGAKKQVLKNLKTREWKRKEIYMIASAESQWLMQTGNTMFKGMGFDDVHRFQCDIEAYSRVGFPNASRETDKIFIISMCDNHGYEMVLHIAPREINIKNDIRFIDEEEMLKYWVNLFNRLDPDIIEGHNFLSFDLPYLMTRCERYGIKVDIGRDGSVPTFYDTQIRFAERQIEYPAYTIAGRHIIDTYFLVLAFDVVKRSMQDHTLKGSAKYFGFAAENREYIQGDQIAKTWDEDPERVLRYALDDVYETRSIGQHLGGSHFALSQMVPMTYERVARGGSATKVEHIMVREYLEKRHSIPTFKAGRMEVGGYTDIFKIGVFNNIVYADIESLYPSIMLNYNVMPSTDTLKVFPKVLRELTDLRLQTKAEMRALEDVNGRPFVGREKEHESLDHKQAAYKIQTNSLFGSLGFSFFIFNDFIQADRVCTIGQGLLKKMLREVENDGGKPIIVDTDGILCIPPKWVYNQDHSEGKAVAVLEMDNDVSGPFPMGDRDWVKSLTKRMPKGIVVGFDGRATSMLSLRKKNYALVEGKLKIKGGSFKSRIIELFRREFVVEIITTILERDPVKVHEIYTRYWTKVFTSDWTIDEFCKRTTVKDPLSLYDKKVKLGVGRGGRNADAGYEVAKRIHDSGKHKVVVGDRFAHYCAAPQEIKAYKIRAFQHSKWAEEHDPDNPDENTNWYLKKLMDSAKKFKIFFTEEGWRMLFSEQTDPDFDYSQVEIVQRDVKRKPMQVIIAGGRDIDDIFWVERAIAGAPFLKLIEKADSDPSGNVIAKIIQGGAKGVDAAAKEYAVREGIDNHEEVAQWNNFDVDNVLIKRNTQGRQYNALAGHNRNQLMAEKAMSSIGKEGAALIAVWDGTSRGTRDMIETAKKAGMRVHVSKVPSKQHRTL